MKLKNIIYFLVVILILLGLFSFGYKTYENYQEKRAEELRIEQEKVELERLEKKRQEQITNLENKKNTVLSNNNSFENLKVIIKENLPTHKIATLSAVGDILLHGSVYRDAHIGNNQYDFKPMFELVKPYMEKADITFANQETVIGGVELGLSSYPTFNSPVEIADALQYSGVDIISMANNHTIDRRDKAVPRAIDYLNQIGMLYTGSYNSFEDQQTIRVIEKNGIKFSFLAYTYGTNGIPVPKGKEYLVNLIDKQKIKDEIDRAEEISDVVVLSLHFGNEYQRMPNAAQKELVQFAVDEGADIILGHHPHVLQPVEWVTSKDGNQAFVVYSLGNFLSAQDKLYRLIGGVLNLEVKKTTIGEESTITLQNPSFLVTYNKYHNWKDFKIIPMYQMTDYDLYNANGIYQEIKSHMSQWVPELHFIEEPVYSEENIEQFLPENNIQQ